MFKTHKPKLSFQEQMVKKTLIWGGTLVMLALVFSWTEFSFDHIFPKEKIVTKYVLVGETTPSEDLSHLNNGDFVSWNGIPMCVSSIKTYNFKKHLEEGMDPPVQIFLRDPDKCEQE